MARTDRGFFALPPTVAAAVDGGAARVTSDAARFRLLSVFALALSAGLAQLAPATPPDAVVVAALALLGVALALGVVAGRRGALALVALVAIPLTLALAVGAIAGPDGRAALVVTAAALALGEVAGALTGRTWAGVVVVAVVGVAVPYLSSAGLPLVVAPVAGVAGTAAAAILLVVAAVARDAVPYRCAPDEGPGGAVLTWVEPLRAAGALLVAGDPLSAFIVPRALVSEKSASPGGDAVTSPGATP